MVAVFGSALPQKTGGLFVDAEKFRKAVGVVVVGVAKDCRVHLRKVYAHGGGVLCELSRSACVQQVTVALELDIDGKAPLSAEGRAIVTGCAAVGRAVVGRKIRATGDIIYQNLGKHLAPYRFQPECPSP